MKWVFLVAGILLTVLFEIWVELGAQNHPWRVAIVGASVFGLVGAVLFLFPSGPLVAMTVALASGWAWGLLAGIDAREKQLSWYCKYGAQTQAELDDCMSSIDTSEIEELDTPAARFAYGDTTRCGPGSGPFCPEAAEDVALEYGA